MTLQKSKTVCLKKWHSEKKHEWYSRIKSTIFLVALYINFLEKGL